MTGVSIRAQLPRAASLKDAQVLRAQLHGTLTAIVGRQATSRLTTSRIRRGRKHIVRGDIAKLLFLMAELRSRFGDRIVVKRRVRRRKAVA